MRHSAGTLLYRRTAAGFEVLIVRPSGPAARYGWSIPKGIPEPGEPLEQAARRETREETGVEPDGLEFLGHADYKTGKRIHCFAGPAPDAAEPRTASWEIDRAEFVGLAEARRKLHQDQQPLIDLLEQRLAAI